MRIKSERQPLALDQALQGVLVLVPEAAGRSLCYDIGCDGGGVEGLWSGRRRRTRHCQEESTYECTLGYVAAGARDPQRLYRRPDWTACARVTSGRQVH